MAESNLTARQKEIAETHFETSVFLEGPAGCGKTTAALERLRRLLRAGVPGDAILLIVPQRTLSAAYVQALRHPELPAGRAVNLFTIGSLTRRLVELFWPLVSEAAGFANPHNPPTFLNLETAQYYMAHLVLPLLEGGLFESVSIDHNRLYSQIIDNLNKAALVGFPYTEIGERLKNAWVGEPSQLRVYADVQTCADLFRDYCLTHNLVDFSLQIEVFLGYLCPALACQDYIQSTYRHLIFDNIEEDTPIAHDLLTQWLPNFDSALLVYDSDAGIRYFLGADPVSAHSLRDVCAVTVKFEESFVNSLEMSSIESKLEAILLPKTAWGDDRQPVISEAEPSISVEGGAENRSFEAFAEPAIRYSYHRFTPQMLDWTADQVAHLIHDQGLAPNEIVILAPYLSDALRFSLTNRLESRRVQVRSHRPSRALSDEPATGCLLTLANLAYPDWGLVPSKFDVAYALMQAIDGLDLVRAQLLTDIVYRHRSGEPWLSSFEKIKADVRERITYRLGERYERLRLWLDRARQHTDDLDFFLSRLFGEVLSQPGFGFHRDFDAGKVAANLIDSVQNFRWTVGPILAQEGVSLGKEYIRMVRDGVIAAQYLRGWQSDNPEAVLLAPAYTFLMSNRPVEVQFWLDIGSRGWSERLNQPLTHPYVLSRRWSTGRPWTDADEYAAQSETLYRLILGLVRRCRRNIYMGLSDLSEQGYEQRGPLLHALSRLLTEDRQ